MKPSRWGERLDVQPLPHIYHVPCISCDSTWKILIYDLSTTDASRLDEEREDMLCQSFEESPFGPSLTEVGSKPHDYDLFRPTSIHQWELPLPPRKCSRHNYGSFLCSFPFPSFAVDQGWTCEVINQTIGGGIGLYDHLKDDRDRCYERAQFPKFLVILFYTHSLVSDQREWGWQFQAWWTRFEVEQLEVWGGRQV